jgi:hypothetical protein
MGDAGPYGATAGVGPARGRGSRTVTTSEGNRRVRPSGLGAGRLPRAGRCLATLPGSVRARLPRAALPDRLALPECDRRHRGDETRGGTSGPARPFARACDVGAGRAGHGLGQRRADCAPSMVRAAATGVAAPRPGAALAAAGSGRAGPGTACWPVRHGSADPAGRGMICAGCSETGSRRALLPRLACGQAAPRDTWSMSKLRWMRRGACPGASGWRAPPGCAGVGPGSAEPGHPGHPTGDGGFFPDRGRGVSGRWLRRRRRGGRTCGPVRREPRAPQSGLCTVHKRAIH